MSVPTGATVVSAEVIAVGDELLAGDIVNRNAATISTALAGIGVPTDRHTSVGDDIAIIAAALADALTRSRVVIVTGGLGPTQDDLTREAIAVLLGTDLVENPALRDELVARLEARGRKAPAMNLRQAQLPVGSTAIVNPVGTAPGVRAEHAGGTVWALPGVPAEMRAMLSDSVLADVERAMPVPQAVSVRIVRTSGIWESAVATAMAPAVERARAAGGPVIAFLAGGGQTRVKITGYAGTAAEADALVEPVEAFAIQVLGEAVYGGTDDSLESGVLATLRARGETLAAAESLTGGLLAGALTDVPGASEVFLGSITAYATPLKHELLGVDAGLLQRVGAVSRETAEAMALGVRERLGADWGIATTGVAGPAEQEGKPAGTVHVAVAGPAGLVRHQLLVLPGERGLVRAAAVTQGLDLLRRSLLASVR